MLKVSLELQEILTEPYGGVNSDSWQGGSV